MGYTKNKYVPQILRTQRRKILTVMGGAVIGVIGVIATLLSMAATSVTPIETESGVTDQCIHRVTDTTASGGSAVRFGGATGCANAGANLPITYSLANLGGTVRYVATNGNDTTGTGTSASPYATLGRAISAASSGDAIVIRGGTYRQGNASIPSNKTLHIAAYPGETPVFNGAVPASNWATEGSLRYIAYTPQPVTDGSGISFTTGQNLAAGSIGKYPDQAWVGSTQLRQVATKSEVNDGEFWVDGTNNRLYISANDASKESVEVSQLDNFLDINAPNTIIEGLQVTRYSNSANDYGVIDIKSTADGTIVRNIDMSDSAFQIISFSGSSDLLNNCTLEHATLTKGNWMGTVALYTDNFTMDSVKISGMNQFNEFTSSPQSGAFKTSRTWHTKVLGSTITDNKSYGIWFDQSNYDVQIANNYIADSKQDTADNHSSNIFFEISDNMLLINNYLKQSDKGINFKAAGSSGLKLVNNTIVGGAAPVSIAADNRSIAGCADPAQQLCANSYSSDRDTVRPHLATMDWMPRLDLMINNIIAHPTSNAAYCGTLTTLCIKLTNGSAMRTIDSVIHKADPARRIPQTYANSNVYANGTSRIIDIPTFGNYTTPGAFGTAMAGAPVSISGLEANGLAGTSYVNPDGSPTAALAALHNQAQPIPTDSAINQYIPAGTRHFGVAYQ